MDTYIIIRRRVDNISLKQDFKVDLIYGVVYEIDESESALDRAEGLGYGYDEKTVTVSILKEVL